MDTTIIDTSQSTTTGTKNPQLQTNSSTQQQYYNPIHGTLFEFDTRRNNFSGKKTPKSSSTPNFSLFFHRPPQVPPAGHVKKHPEPILNRLFARNHHGNKPLSPPNEKGRILVEKSYLSSSKDSGFDGGVATGGVDLVGIIGDQGGRRGTDRFPGEEPGEGGGEEHEDEAQRAHRLLCSPTPTHREGQHDGSAALVHRRSAKHAKKAT